MEKNCHVYLCMKDLIKLKKTTLKLGTYLLQEFLYHWFGPSQTKKLQKIKGSKYFLFQTSCHSYSPPLCLQHDIKIKSVVKFSWCFYSLAWREKRTRMIAKNWKLPGSLEDQWDLNWQAVKLQFVCNFLNNYKNT